MKLLSIHQIRGLRIGNRITQKDFAELMNVPVSSWGNIELGNNKFHKWLQERATNIMIELGLYTPELPEGGDSPGETVNSIIKGVSKEEPRETNEQGGSQSRVLYDFTLADPKAMFEMCKVLKEGADKYGAENWRLIDINDHLNHMLIHAYAYLAGDRSDEHLSHIMCRALFAQGVAVQTEEDIKRVKQEG